MLQRGAPTSFLLLLAACITAGWGCTDAVQPREDSADVGPDDADTAEGPPDAAPLEDAADAPPDLGLDTPLEDASPPVCDEETRRCTARGLQTCQEGAWSLPEPCEEGSRCVIDSCRPRICTANEAACVDPTTLGICTFDETALELFPCAEGATCEAGRCRSGCAPGAISCSDDAILQCDADGQHQTVLRRCSLEDGFECIDGACVASCSAVSTKGQYIGCEFWGVDTPNLFGVSNRFAFVVSNVDGERTANVTVRDRFGALLAEAQIPPRDVATLRMPSPRMMNVNRSGIFDAGFHISSDVPINAYQFNPLQRIDPENPGTPPASNDASLLLPTSALGEEHIGVAYTHWGGFSSFLSVVSPADGNTLTITPTAPTREGPNLPALQAGVPTTVVLEAGQVLNLMTLNAGDDLTGTHIQSVLGVAVFGGVDCAQIPIDRMFCDHIEESIFPVETWDTTYYAARFAPREGSADFFRVVAAEDGTILSTEPSQATFPLLNRGEFYDFQSLEDFKLIASSPVLLVQYMQGSTVGVEVDRGDPSMLTVIPTRQFRTDYVFLVPDTYAEDYVNLVFPFGVRPVLDGVPVSLSQVSTIGVTGFFALRVRVDDGRHTVSAEAPFGAYVYGYDHNISYAYPAGLDLAAP